MRAERSERGEMSQVSAAPELHRTVVSPTSHRSDPASVRAKQALATLSASSVGLELGISVVLGLVAGIYLDRWLGSEPWLLLAGMLLGLVAGFRGVLRAVHRADREEIVNG